MSLHLSRNTAKATADTGGSIKGWETRMTNTLYCFAESGNAYKAALALELAGVP
jgi:hypothetical protein